MPTSSHRVIGVDLGTTTCAASIWDGNRLVVLPATPSVVGHNAAGHVLVGRAPAAGTITGVKRRLGTGVPVRFRGHTYQPRDICAFLLLELKRQAEAYIGAPVHDAVITVPSTSGEPQRRALREAAGLAQLNVRRLIDDPVAAAAAFDGEGRTRTYAIYDLGGGTFDAAIVRIGPGTVDVLGTAGDPNLGGDDFDERIVSFALRQIRERHHVDLALDQRIRQRIRWEAEIRKRELSTAEATALELPALTATVGATVPLSRRAFETMIEPDVERSLDHLGAALAAAGSAHGIGRGHIDQVLLAGGSTRIPWIRMRLADYFGLEQEDIRSDVAPDELVARGAGLIAREYEPAPLFEGSPPGLLSASLRLRSELADPEQEAAAAQPPATGPPGVLPEPPAETPADFRPVAERSHGLLSAAGPETHPELRTAYTGFVTAILAAAPDVRLAELGEALRAEYDGFSPDGAAGTYP